MIVNALHFCYHFSIPPKQGKTSVYIYSKPSSPTKPIVYNPQPISRSPPGSPKPSRKSASSISSTQNSITKSREPVALKFRTSSPAPKSYPSPNSNNFLTTCFLTLGRPKHHDNSRARGGKERSEEALNLEVVRTAWKQRLIK